MCGCVCVCVCVCVCDMDMLADRMALTLRECGSRETLCVFVCGRGDERDSVCA